MTFDTTRTFLSAAITNVSINMGWGNTPSTITVGLVNDTTNEYILTVPSVGEPKIFELDGWEFGGIVTEYRENNSQGGAPVFSVVLQDPREVLSNTTVILDGYTDAVTAVPNVINVFGYWESQGFGSSGRTSAGIPWKKVRDAIVTLTANTSIEFGGNIYLKGYGYELNLSQLPTLPDSYRITASYMSVMDFIIEICGAANCDFFFELDTTSVIKLYTINKNYQPEYGAIERFLRSTPNAVQKNFGREFRNETTSKFLVGANKEEILLTYQEGGGDEVSVDAVPYRKWLYYTDRDDNQASYDAYKAARDNGGTVRKKMAESEDWDAFPIWPFWGVDDTGSFILGEGYGNEHSFTINSQWVPAAGVGDTYGTDVGELLAAQSSQDAWETFLNFHNYLYFKIDNDGPFEDYLRIPNLPLKQSEASTKWEAADGPTPPYAFLQARNSNQDLLYYNEAGNGTTNVPQDNSKPYPVQTSYKHSGERNPHFGKAYRFGVASNSSALAVAFVGAKWATKAFADWSPKNMILSGQSNIPNTTKKQENSEIVWGYLKKFADEYLGKAFMIKASSIQSYLDTETGQTITSHKPQGDGFVEESIWPTAISKNILPEDINKFTTAENGKIYAYVRFSQKHLNRFDFREIDVQSIAVNLVRDKFGNPIRSENEFGQPTEKVGKDDERPIKGAFVKVQVEPYIVYGNYATRSDPRLVIRLPGAVRAYSDEDRTYYNSRIIQDFLYTFDRARGLSDAEIATKIKTLQTRIAADQFNVVRRPMPVIPDLAAVGLYYNNDFYGPWTIAGTSSKTEYEKDDSLAPWNYGGYTLMNTAAEAKLSQLAATNLEAENGSVEVPGFPAIKLGRQLISGGPYITNISVAIEQNRVTTTYNMNTWSYHPYKLAKEQVELLKRTTLRDQKLRRTMRDLQSHRFLDKPEALRSETQLGIISRRKNNWTSSTIISAEILGGQINAAIQPNYNAQSQATENIGGKSIMSLDGLFCPFSTYQQELGILPGLKIDATGDYNWRWFDRFSSPTGISIISNGDGDNDYNTNVIMPTGEVRGVAFRSPLYLAGWGYSTSGTIVGASSGNTENPSDYVVGPLDVRWNESKGVWVAGNSDYSNNKIVRIIYQNNALYSGAVVSLAVNRDTGNITYSDTGEVLEILNFRNNTVIPSSYYIATPVADYYVLDNQSVFLWY